jgi:hypothetical protein
MATPPDPWGAGGVGGGRTILTRGWGFDQGPVAGWSPDLVDQAAEADRLTPDLGGEVSS